MLIALAITGAVFTAILQAVALANANLDISKFLMFPVFSGKRKKGRIALNDSPLLNQSHTRVIPHAPFLQSSGVWCLWSADKSITRSE